MEVKLQVFKFLGFVTFQFIVSSVHRWSFMSASLEFLLRCYLKLGIKTKHLWANVSKEVPRLYLEQVMTSTNVKEYFQEHPSKSILVLYMCTYPADYQRLIELFSSGDAESPRSTAEKGHGGFDSLGSHIRIWDCVEKTKRRRKIFSCK